MTDICESGTEESKIVEARKLHICCECSKTIYAGEKYWKFKALWKGIGWETFKTCLKCKKIRELTENKYCKGSWDEFPAFGELYWFIRESKKE